MSSTTPQPDPADVLSPRRAHPVANHGHTWCHCPADEDHQWCCNPQCEWCYPKDQR